MAADLGTWIVQSGVDDPVTGANAVEDASGFAAVAGELSDTGHLAVISQTCDIALTGPGKRHPLVQVCPVRDVGAAFSGEKLEQIKRGEVGEYVYLTAAPIDTADWAIDLRASFPISKGVLLTTVPVEGFANEEDELALAQRIGVKFRRPALHDAVADLIVNAFNSAIGRAKGTAVWCDDVEQIRLEILRGSRLSPQLVRAVVVTDTKFDPSWRTPLRDVWKAQRKLLQAHGIAQAAIAFRTLAEWDIRDYRASIPLNVPALGRGSFE
ncbi:MAG: hypothetical protein ACTHNQ_05220 [Microbacterium sp.]|uniref:hypothetical protein n=1 Tax=Microbacterium sp. TaxID=51671 RepID=UPI003F7D48E6